MLQEGFKQWSRKYAMIAAAIVLLAALAIAGIYQWKKSRQKSSSPSNPPSLENNSLTEAIDVYQLALQKIEEDRGEPTGNKAQVTVPAELKLYQDKRRFLAIQVAEWRKQSYEIPHDFSELVPMIQRAEFTVLPTLGSDYVLYGVGLRADDELTHYDQKTSKSIPLFREENEIEIELGRLDTSLKDFEAKALELKNDLAKVKKADRALRGEALRQINETQKFIKSTKTRRDLIASFYKSKEHRQLMTREYQRLVELAGNFDGRSYDLNDPIARKKFKMHLLSALRPSARTQLEEIAKAYRNKFDRPLPVTSLVRTKEYQWQLGEAGNPNAVRIDVPPHTTGLAFDIYTFYMNAAEQQFLMYEIARLEREGRVEALREIRHHIHVFAFADAKPPDERLIKESLTMKASQANSEQE
jgi:Family of unknown function (DUF5715)